MFKNLFSLKSKLLRDIRNDNYKNWELHLNNHKADPARLQSFGLEIYEYHLKVIIEDHSITDEEKDVLRRIQDYFHLSNAAINAVKSKYAKKALTDLSKQKLADNQLTQEEIQEMELFAAALNISEEEVKRINQINAAELYEKSVKQAVADNMVSVEEHQALKKLAQQLGIDLREAAIDKKLQQDYYYLVLLNALEQGYLPEVKLPSITTQEDEKACWEISSNLVFTRTITTGFIGSHIRLKVAKGVSYKIGSCKNTSIREHTGANHQGVFVVTNRRVIFAARQQSFSIPFTQLSSFDTYTDGIGLQNNNMELLLQFYDKQMSEVVFKVLTNAINAHA